MGQSARGRLLQELERIVTEGQPVDIVANASSISTRLALEFPEAGMSAFDVSMEILRLVGEQERPVGQRPKGLAI